MQIKKLLFLFFMLLFAGVVHAQMVLEYDITTVNTQIALPLNGTVNVQVDWGDGTLSESFITAGDKPHTYTSIGTKTVTITGALTQFGSSTNSSGNYSLTKVLNWHGLGLKSLAYAFSRSSIKEVPASLPWTVTDLNHMFYMSYTFNQDIGSWNTSAITDMSYMFQYTTFNQPIGSWNTASVTNMTYMFDSSIFNQPIGGWNTGAVTNMSFMFSYTSVFDQPIGNWNTSAVTDMSFMFLQADAFDQPVGDWNTAAVTNMNGLFARTKFFNQPLNKWNTGAVKNMNGMFYKAIAFNQPIDAWNTAAVTDMSSMFSNATAFDQPIGNWNTAAVTDMSYMFESATSFNQPIGTWNTMSVWNMGSMFAGAHTFNQPINTWNTGSVIIMGGMFFNASAFNQPIGSWNTATVNNMDYMFKSATEFNQSIGTWNITAVTRMASMFENAGLCTDNYDATLIGWSTQVVKTGVSLNGGSSKYSALSANARAALISKGWAISDGGPGSTADAKCRSNQTITFDALNVKILADASFNLTAVASSGLPLTYTSSNTAVATINGNTVTIVGIGVTTITALQAGDTNYKPAANVTQLLTVQPKLLLSYNIIRGTIYTDGNTDCIKQSSEKPLSSIVVKAMPGEFYGYTDDNGNYEIRVDTGTVVYTLTQQYNAKNAIVLVNQCAASHSVSLKGASIDTASFDFANEVRACTLPTVDVQHEQLVRCFKSSAYIQYCNLGNATINNAVIKVEYPAYLIPKSSFPMWSYKVGSTLYYDIATLEEANCGQIKIIDSVDCSLQAIIGLTQCIKVSITPGSTCTSQSTLWDFSSTEIAGTCENNQAAFVLTNTGDGDMADSLAYRIYVNDTLIYNGKYKLLSNTTLKIKYPAQAQTVRLEADQHPNHPGNSHPKAIVESCGVSATGFVPKGLVTTTSQDDLDENIAIVCYPITGSFDPNDKQASPTGVGLTHQVTPGTELEYTIRFQNTGTAMAHTVKIVDTLDVNLDVASIIQGVSSHSYTLTITGKGQAVLTYIFDNINLPDSTSDKLGSNGLVSFRITIPSDAALGTVIHNKAYIYFDYNDPILTNNTMHTVGITTIADLSKGQNVQVGNLTTGVLYNQNTNAVKMYPNPSDGIVTLEMAESVNNLELRITSVSGVLLKTIRLTNTTKQQVNIGDIHQGMYLYEIWKDGERSSVGTLQIW